MNIVTPAAVLLTVFITAGLIVFDPETARSHPQTLAGCPKRPNCVSSSADTTRHKVAPFRLKGNPDTAWEGIVQQVGALPQTRVRASDDRYLHAECVSRLFGFIDDLELLRHDDGVVSIRSAARTGYYDFGVNRRRVSALEKTLRGMGFID
jgi:uncharacterized protein (DUF1499 family)